MGRVSAPLGSNHRELASDTFLSVVIWRFFHLILQANVYAAARRHSKLSCHDRLLPLSKHRTETRLSDSVKTIFPMLSTVRQLRLKPITHTLASLILICISGCLQGLATNSLQRSRTDHRLCTTGMALGTSMSSSSSAIGGTRRDGVDSMYIDAC